MFFPVSFLKRVFVVVSSMSDEHKSDDFSWTTKWIIVGGAAAAVAVVGAYFAFKYRKEHFTGVGRKQYADGSVRF